MKNTPSLSALILGLCLFLVAGGLSAQSYEWNLNNVGNWAVNANWNPNTGFPDAVGAEAIFGAVITANRTITVNQPVTVGRLELNKNNNYTLAGSNAITLQAMEGMDAILFVNNALGNGAHTISAPVNFASPTVLTRLSTGTLTLSGATQFGANLTVENSSATNLITFSGAPSGSGTISLSGPGITQFTNSGTYANDFVIGEGATLRTGNTTSYSGNVSGSGVFHKASAFGTVTFTGSFEGFSGTLLLSPGQITFDRNAAWSGLANGSIRSPDQGQSFWSAAGHGAFMAYQPADAAEMNAFIQKFDSSTLAKVGFQGELGTVDSVVDLSQHPKLSFSASPVAGGDGTYHGRVVVGAGNPYQLGGAGTLTLTREGALSGDHAVWITQGGNVSLTAPQTYTGGTRLGVEPAIINGSGTIMFNFNPGVHGSPFGSGPVVVERGGIEVGGPDGTFVGLANTMVWEDGSFITFDNRQAVNNNRYGDATPLVFSVGRNSLQLRGNLETPVSEQIGPVTLAGGFTNIYPWVEYSAEAADPTRTAPAEVHLKMESLTRSDPTSVVRISSVPVFNAIPAERPEGYLGDQARVIVTDASAKAALVNQITNGMLPAHYVDPTTNSFLTYDTGMLRGEEIGFRNVAYTSTDLLSSGPTDIVTSGAVAVPEAVSVHALRATGALTGAGTVTIGSGGLISHIGAATTSSVNLNFGGQHAYINTSNSNFVHTLSGALTNAAGLTKAGARQITLTGDLSGVQGPFVVAEGVLRIDRADGSAQPGMGNSELTIHNGGSVQLFNTTANTTMVYTFRNLSGRGNLQQNSAANTQHINLVLNNTADSVFEGNLNSNQGASLVNRLLHLTKEGPGTLHLTSRNVTDYVLGYNGTTTINEGRLIIDGWKNVAAPIVVNNSGILAGSGTLAGDITVNAGGALAPGNSPGTMTLTNGLNLAAGSQLHFEAGDLVLLTGAADRTLGVAEGAQLILHGMFDLGNYTLVDWSQVSGVVTTAFGSPDFFSVTWPSASGWEGQISQVGSTLQLQVTQVPEPALMAACFGLAALLWTLSRRRRLG